MQYTVLTIDDEPEIIELVQALLERAGYRVLGANGAEHALEILANEQPHLILCDVMMSEFGGFKLVRQLKADPVTADIPVIMVSAMGGATSISDGWLVGADMYITKPFNPDELISMVERFTSHHSGYVHDSIPLAPG